MTAHDCREQALAAQVELLTHRLVECRMLNDRLQQQHLDDERRMRGTSAATDPRELLCSHPKRLHSVDQPGLVVCSDCLAVSIDPAGQP